MELRIDPRIFERFPDTRIGVLILEELNNSATHTAVLDLLRAEELRQRDLIKDIELPSLPEIKAWRETYRGFGSDPRDFRSSIEALLRRARAGNKPLPNINALVDLYNYLSLKYHLPVGAEDLDSIDGNIELTFADGSEQGLCLGAAAPENCQSGEVIYRDKVGFLCRRWNWREADRTKITPATKRAVVVIDTVGGIGNEVLELALDEMAELAKTHLSGQKPIVIKVKTVLDPESPAIAW